MSCAARVIIAAVGILAAAACGSGSSTPPSAPPLAPAAAIDAAPAPAADRGAEAAGGPASSMQRLLPQKAGDWTRTGAPQRYGPDDLWEYIDGGADMYVSYGFQEVVAAKYSNAGGATATVDIYRMTEPVGAFGIYAQEHNPKATPVRVGAQGQAGTDALRFWAGDYYVKLVSTPPDKSSKEASIALGLGLAAGLGDPGAPPPQLALFPAKGLIPDSIRYVPANILGQADFGNGFEAKYQTGSEPATLVIVPFKDAPGAGAALGRYQTFLGQGGVQATKAPTLCDGSLRAQDRFRGLIIAARSGSWLAVSLGSVDERSARALLTDMCGNLARFSSGPSRKAGVK